jgi:protein gp37
MIRIVDPKSLATREPFSTLFTIDAHVLDAITEDMAAEGYDRSKPIDVWLGEGVVIDGHTRLKAALAAEIEEVAVFDHFFADEDDALEYAIKNQRDRRNWTDAEITRAVMALDERKKHGAEPGGRGNQYAETKENESGKAQPCALPKTAERTAEILGVSPRKVEQTRTVLDHADEDTKAAVLSGEQTINSAYNTTQKRRREEKLVKSAPAHKATFNRTNDNIEWASWSWNPVTGCKHGCTYCYARDIAIRFTGHFQPEFHPNRLDAPQNTKVPDSDNPGDKAVFVCSMADLFGEWVPDEWIDKVLASVRMAPQWTFIFLTKNPGRLADIDWPNNAWVGTTVDCQARVEPAQNAFRNVKARVRFVSCEPLNERVTFTDMSMFNWAIIGGRSKTTGAAAFQPEWEWVIDIVRKAMDAGIMWYRKPNLDLNAIAPKDYPKAQ